MPASSNLHPDFQGLVYTFKVAELHWNGVGGDRLNTNNGNHDASQDVPRTLREVDLRARVRAAGGANLKEAGDFFGWRPSKVIKRASDFTKDLLLAKGWTKDRLVDVAEGYEHIARITPDNPSASGRAAQLREIAKLFD